MSDVPAPSNEALTLVNIIIDGLVKGVGPATVISQAVAAAPWLALPVISYMFKALINALASRLDISMKRNIDIVLVRFQDNSLQKKYDAIVVQFQQQKDLTDAELQKAYATIDSLIQRSK